MNTQTTRQMLNGLLADLYAKREQLADEDIETERDIAALERTLSIVADRSDEPDDTVTATDIAHCKIQRAALYTIANLNGGIVRATEAGDLIKAAGLSDAKRASIIATIHRFMTRNQDWEWTDTGTFRLKSFFPLQP